MNLSEVAPSIGDDVWPLEPAYHRYFSDPVPVAFTARVASSPAAIVWLFGCVVIFGVSESDGGAGDAGGSLGLDGGGGAGGPGFWELWPVSAEVGVVGVSDEQAPARTDRTARMPRSFRVPYMLAMVTCPKSNSHATDEMGEFCGEQG